MTSTVRSRIEYLLPTANILALLLHSNLILKCNLIDGFSIRFNDIQKWLNFHSATLCVTYRSIGMYVNHEFTIAVITVIFALCRDFRQLPWFCRFFTVILIHPYRSTFNGWRNSNVADGSAKREDKHILICMPSSSTIAKHSDYMETPNIDASRPFCTPSIVVNGARSFIRVGQFKYLQGGLRRRRLQPRVKKLDSILLRLMVMSVCVTY